ncbi:acyl-CoA dehydrogenase family protein [Streptomyces cyaneofuscatus]|uniref:acyl-CoA dehydrogenase family protein n=1 Tax=Streptomyces cyaneofuscatus TaxID=66883 RepID=UPI00341403A0
MRTVVSGGGVDAAGRIGQGEGQDVVTREGPRPAPDYPPYALAGAFDRELGDPARPDLPFFPGRLRELDAAEDFPADQVRLLDAAGLPAHYVPARHGGALHSYEDLLHLVRVVARRDLTVAIAHTKTYLGAVSTWVAGSAEQARALGERVAAGAVVSWGLTEREHGSDLLSGTLTATRTPDGGYRLDGEKWLINNATRCDLICVLARTGPAGGTRGYSLLLVDRSTLADGTHTPLPAARTHGIRGADISGISFTGARVPASALLGAEGSGIETVLRALQITRTLCASLSLGAGDHALRIATGFGLEHQLYGKRLIDLPQARRSLTEAYADLLTAEAVTLLAARGMHTLTEEMSVTSPTLKYLVPATVDQLVTDMGQFLGARSFLSEDFAHGAFAKLERDHRIVGIFDGNSLVNLNALINQFGSLARGYRAGRTEADALATAADLGLPVPEFDPVRLDLTSRGGNSVTASLPPEPTRCACWPTPARCPSPWPTVRRTCARSPTRPTSGWRPTGPPPATCPPTPSTWPTGTRCARPRRPVYRSFCTTGPPAPRAPGATASGWRRVSPGSRPGWHRAGCPLRGPGTRRPSWTTCCPTSSTSAPAGACSRCCPSPSPPPRTTPSGPPGPPPYRSSRRRRDPDRPRTHHRPPLDGRPGSRPR